MCSVAGSESAQRSAKALPRKTRKKTRGAPFRLDVNAHKLYRCAVEQKNMAFRVSSVPSVLQLLPESGVLTICSPQTRTPAAACAKLKTVASTADRNPAACVDCEALTVLRLQCGAISALGQQSFSKVEAFVKLCHLR